MTDDRERLLERYERIRARTLSLARPLEDDEQLAQAFPDASPTKWHLGHTTWFYERLALRAADPGYEPVSPEYDYVFNSYYEAIGPRQPRAARSLAVRPTLAEVHVYRARIDEAIRAWAARADERAWAAVAPALELGTHHEEQHQELMLTDIKPVLTGSHPRVTYPAKPRPIVATPPAQNPWRAHEGGLVEIGWDRAQGFSFDNESPRHRVWLEPFELATRAVTARDYLAFVEAGGYGEPSFWLSDGWATVQSQGWFAPMYWRKTSNGWEEETLAAREPLDLDAPVCHLSYFEADAFARWAGARLPTEAEWEHAAAGEPVVGNFLDAGLLQPRSAGVAGSDSQLFGDVWEWTSSSYSAYPRFVPFSGAASEYNGKFMCGQLVLRGGSCFTPREHMRPTYRNFFPPSARWQMTGLRLARSR
jgi:ergothioneine biosynthesis protein EgtB